MAADEPMTDDPTAHASAAASALSRARRQVIGAAPVPPRPTPPAVNAGAVDDRPVEPVVAKDNSSAAPSQTRKSRAGRNLTAAIAVALGLGALVVASLFVYRPSFAVLVGIAVLYGCYELATAMKSAQIRVSLVPLLVGGAAVLVAAWLRGPNGLVLALFITVLGIALWRIGDGALGYTRDVSASVLTALYVPTLASFALLLAHPDDGAGRVLAFVATVVCSDTGGYATGVLFGRHPLAPIVSKGKTWEGFAGSIIACSIAGVLFLTLTFHEAWWKGLLFGVAVCVTATLGDLGESMIKRDLDVKDMGSLLPGHGGLMDRLDSLLPCAAVAYLLLSGFAPV